MEFFSTGVTRDKLMILHGLTKLGIMPTKVQMTDFFGIYDLINYFELQSAVYELEEDGLISAVPRPYGQAYFVTPQGAETLDMFKVSLPSSLRERIARCAEEYAPILLKKTQFSTRIETATLNSRRVILRAMEQHGDLIRIELLLPDEAAAKHACAVWEERSEAIFTAVYSELTRE